MNSQSTNDGFVMSELLCGLFLSAIIATGVFSSLKTAHFTFRLLSERQDNLQKTERIFQMLENSFRRANYYPMIQTVKITAGESANPNSIAFLELSQNNWLQPIGSSAPGVFCKRELFVQLPPETFPPTHGHYLALGLDGYWEVTATAKRNRNSKHCGADKAYDMSALQKHAFPGFWDFRPLVWISEPQLSDALLLLPISDSYSFRLADDGNLRRESFLTSERQPIDGNWEALSTQALPAAFGRNWFKVSLSAKSKVSRDDFRRSATYSTSKPSRLAWLDLVLR